MKNIDRRIVDALEVNGIEYNSADYDPIKSFGENDIDSLDVMTLLLAIEEKFGVKFTEEESNAMSTPDDISKSLDQRMAQG